MSSPQQRKQPGVLVVGHGTRDDSGLAEFMATAKAVADAFGEMPVEPCFLELAEPNIAAGLARLVERSVSEVVAMPVLLFAAGHAKHDIPAAVAEAAAAHQGVNWQLAEHLGCHPSILELSAERYRQSLERNGPAAGLEVLGSSTLILVGRGSNDADATREMFDFAARRSVLTPGADVIVCFAAMAKPSLGEALDQVSRLGGQLVVVQPHLLFDGLLLGGIREKVADAATRNPRHRFILADHLGPDPRVVAAIRDRIEQTLLSGKPAATQQQPPSVKT